MSSLTLRSGIVNHFSPSSFVCADSVDRTSYTIPPVVFCNHGLNIFNVRMGIMCIKKAKAMLLKGERFPLSFTPF